MKEKNIYGRTIEKEILFQKYGITSTQTKYINQPIRKAEGQFILFALNLTEAMKKSYKKHGNDLFYIEDIDIRTLNVGNSSLSTINIKKLKQIIEYVNEIAQDLTNINNVRPTYTKVRKALMERKVFNFKNLLND